METVIKKTTIKKYPAYKDSGVEWLGEIPSEWATKKLKFLAEIQKGKLPRIIISANESNLPPYMSMEYLRGGAENQWVLDKNPKIINENETLLLWDGSNAGEFIKSRKGVISSTVALISFYNIDNNYAWYFSKFLEIELRGKTIGMGIPHVNGDELRNSIISVPPLSEQNVIASFLDSKTALIDQASKIKKKQIELLKERRQILIHNAVTKGLDNKVKLKDSGVQWIGQIPEHWKVESLKNILTERNEKNDPIKTREILSLSIDKGVTLYAGKTTNLDRFKDDFSQYKLAHKGDLVFNSMNMIVGAVGVSDYFGCVSPVYYTYYGRYNNSNTKFYEYLFRCKTLQGVLYSLGKGLLAIDRGEGKYNTLRLKVSRDDLRSLRLPFPSYSEQNQIISYIETQSSKIETLISLKVQEIEKLKEYKATLINSAVTGKIKVS